MDLKKLQCGDLIAHSANNLIYKGVLIKIRNNCLTYRYLLWNRTSHIYGSSLYRRVVKITIDSLTENELDSYIKIQQELNII